MHIFKICDAWQLQRHHKKLIFIFIWCKLRQIEQNTNWKMFSGHKCTRLAFPVTLKTQKDKTEGWRIRGHNWTCFSCKGLIFFSSLGQIRVPGSHEIIIRFWRYMLVDTTLLLVPCSDIKITKFSLQSAARMGLMYLKFLYKKHSRIWISLDE